MKLIERFKGHIDFINLDYVTYAYKLDANYYVRILGMDHPLEVSKEIFIEIVNYGKGIKQKVVQHSNS